MQHNTPSPSDPSWWLTEALQNEGNPTPAPSLEGDERADVVIVGGGFTGLWTAMAIKDRDPAQDIVLIEAKICGAGASGKNGGKVHGYWASLPGLSETLGPDAAIQVAKLGTKAQDGIRAFATTAGRDVWWREAGNVRVSTTAAHDAKIDHHIRVVKQLGVTDTARALSTEEVANYCNSPSFRKGMYLTEGANVQPARLARALRKAAIERGVRIYEHTPMLGVDTGAPNRVRTKGGSIEARDVVLATNTALASERWVKPYVTVFSSYALMSEPAERELANMGWTGDEGMADMRMFVHYFRKTADNRVLMGSGSGPISYNGSSTSPLLTEDQASGARAVAGLRRLLPGLSSVGVSKVWGGGIDISSDRLPFFRTRPGARVHYAAGYSGHGVNPTYIGGQCLAALVLNAKDEWVNSPFCRREVPKLPPEPFRTVGGRLVRRAIMGCEAAEDRGETPRLIYRVGAAIPKTFGLRIGTR
ncbi:MULTISPECIES: NAD(P)/FAD-dependent oxidoreductase [unclassified Sulfitobacter]|uniref:NAD(P)/FAD-dependent oxidoreductase n=1 Tax=unclassified Sulfitobacter TaxID=196795 RepID=UPI0007C2D22A|nr:MULTISPECIES: FAD-dependent oxidoreductase [unclassified Sulfitobacter]KZX97856.1 FAD-dependent oxidoreductase [Sulfitobacter sp. HI0027]KZX99797.1 FAD-dependent oxidoreductase [Sulfitobacter sp. HI0021]